MPASPRPQSCASASWHGAPPVSAAGQAPEWQLYPGAVERWRAYWQKYVPVRSVFDRQSQIKNFLARSVKGVRSAQVEEYAAPLYHVPRWARAKRVTESISRKNVAAPIMGLATNRKILSNKQ